MTLREKFEQYSKKEVWEKRNYNAEECVDIADVLAIGFAKWCLADFYTSLQSGIDAKADTMEELLEIYKKENQL